MKYLALGDSYTIGEQVDYRHNFPSQTVDILHQQGIDIRLDKLIATTGWTTDELAAALSEARPAGTYDWVSLLIGVNNQYRGRSAEEYKIQFYGLLCQAILYAGARPERVVVLSIPDWGLTPFNTERDRAQTSAEIDEYNRINRAITLDMGCHYLDITASTREHANDADYLTEDQLHYSGKEYRLWAEKLAAIIRTSVKA